MSVSEMQETTWNGTIPIRITLSPLDCRTYDISYPYLTHVSRLSYLPFLLPKLHEFYYNALIDPAIPSSQGWFSFEDAPLKWQHPIGLLFDLLSGLSQAKPSATKDHEGRSLSQDHHARPATNLPWNLIVHFSEEPPSNLIPLDPPGKAHVDAFFQNVKEADYLRNGNAKVILSLSKEDSDSLWLSVQEQNLAKYLPIYRKFLHPPSGEGLRNIPIKVYIPQAASIEDQPSKGGGLRVVQGPMPALTTARTPQTLGTALHTLLPKLFPSRTVYIHARAVLHGAVVPPATRLLELLEGAAFCDGFLHIAVIVMEFDDQG